VVFTAVTAALNALSPRARQYRIPETTWHGYAPVFYRLQDAPPWLLVDLVVMKISSSPANRFLEPERHGGQVVLFDDDGLVHPKPFGRPAHEAAMRTRLVHLVARFDLFHVFVDKAIWRQDTADAVSTYHVVTIRPLVELLRMRYCPDRYDFGLRYLDRDLPLEVRRQVESLLFCGNLEKLAEKQATAVALFQATPNDLRQAGLMD